MEGLAAAWGGLLLAWAGSCLGACCGLLPFRPTPRLQALSLGLAAGVMIAAALLGLVPDALALAGAGRAHLVWIGFAAGLGGIALIDRLLPHQHPGAEGADHGHGLRIGAAQLIALALILHNIPEGMAVGVAASAGEASPSGPAMLIAMALHNVLEGLLIAVPLRLAGMRPLGACAVGQFAGGVEVLAGVLAAHWLPQDSSAIPFSLAAAAGAMVFIAFEELLPESLRCDGGNAGPLGAALGVGGLIVLGGMLR